MLTSHRLSTGPAEDATKTPARPDQTQRLLSRAHHSRSAGDSLTPSRPQKDWRPCQVTAPLWASRNPSKDAGLRGTPFRPQQTTEAAPAPAERRCITQKPRINR